MQEDNSMVEKILTDLENIICYDDNLKQFDIIPVLENDKNKSPVLYEEHNVGLEMWCVKYVYSYVHSCLLKIRKHLKRNLSQSDIEKTNRLLLGAVLLQPDVSTFWNMRRDLIEMNLLKIDKELLLTKLVLSYKNKSNEAFSHRRWIFKRMLKNISAINAEDVQRLIEEELLVAKMACEKVANNYHSWTHKLWLIDNISDSTLKSVIIKKEFDSSLTWVLSNVSEHSGFHYRQRLLLLVHNYVALNDNFFKDYKRFILSYLQVTSNSTESLLSYLLGENDSKLNDHYLSLVLLLLFELFYTCYELNKSYRGHESVWYHRRDNIIQRDRDTIILNNETQENGEKYPKLFKGERRIVEDTFMYKLILKTETDLINNGVF
ncbi:protein farnesyltransferase alpha subunit/rab geranylgeranyl transferase alpha subunit [Holotrichia oblita]|uniref:Protein farnesyltransferase alpha subunit/rab geranylgeranyl transferase alpha subunit n=1 Tax=Holotrichia oblita TaxID=644536 RepID=A0ACB9SZG4_HOLOL|nr:protein farnesyltransferase alpha subunit/rab geranylgeranyl transferase alpha subunit [Holotrichia oblita]